MYCLAYAIESQLLTFSVLCKGKESVKRSILIQTSPIGECYGECYLEAKQLTLAASSFGAAVGGKSLTGADDVGGAGDAGEVVVVVAAAPVDEDGSWPS